MRYYIKICIFITLFLTIATWYKGWFIGLDDTAIRSAATVAAQVSATLLGFLITGLSILASVSGNNLLRKMQISGHYRVLLKKIFTVSMWYAFSLAIGCWTVISPKQFLYISAYICLWVFLSSVFMLGDIGWRFWLVLKNI
ncbi:hypothetical protein FE394_18035 [Xenorhabdus sp. Reich]|uniref:Uncharacterized protein n=1 Tax=Xenorhabdus littoralis TaxID=2582835 RepID=A0ABU4SQW6_9GAMM|nr:hypothetical protein [Xenorhabdus sp. Reich]MDX8001038.1 hypothetical protein [Xenorhabdus sp. Reich]